MWEVRGKGGGKGGQARAISGRKESKYIQEGRR